MVELTGATACSRVCVPCPSPNLLEGFRLSNRNQSLDVLRGIAILLVLGYHFGYYSVWHKIGWCGVDLFFVLSGFLISGLLFREYINTGRIRFGRFLVRRAFKIWPPLYVFLLVMFLVLNSVGQLPVRDLVRSALFVRNYYMLPDASWFLGHTWSLAVEEHFYVLLPLLLFAMIRWKLDFTWSLFLFAASAAVCLTLRIALKPVEAYATHFRIDGLFGGVALGYVYNFRPMWFKRLSTHVSLICGILLLAPVVIFDERDRAMQTWGLTALLCGFSLIVAWSVNRKPPAVVRPIALIGVFSYSVYLWQQPISTLMSGLWRPSFLSYWSYVVVSFGFGAIMAKLIEFPALRVRERLEPRLPGGLNSLWPAESKSIRCAN